MNQHVYVYSPSGAVRDKAAFRRGIKRLEGLGFSVEVDKDALSSHLRFAGDDETRLAAIRRAAHSGADVAMISRGGYGITRLLHDMPWKELSKAICKGTQFVGLSDFTAFQLGLLAQQGAATWAGPAVCEAFGVPATQEPDEIMLACFCEMLDGTGEGVGWRQSPPSQSGASQPPQDFHVRSGVLWGGNLSVLVALLGTPYFPKIKKGILFLEDVSEHPYRIERMLTQLLHAGVLADQRAIVLGQFSNYKLLSHDRGYRFSSVVEWIKTQTKTPVITNLPFGHVATKVTLPVGAQCSLTVEGRDALLFWGEH